MPEALSYENIRFHPPAPVLPVIASRLPGAAGSPRRRLLALCDTGADLSCIPIETVLELALVPVGDVEVSGYDGPPKIKPVFAATLAVVGLPPRIFRVVAVEDPEGAILGRDVLNLLRIQFDGPAAKLTIL